MSCIQEKHTKEASGNFDAGLKNQQPRLSLLQVKVGNKLKHFLLSNNSSGVYANDDLEDNFFRS